MALSVVALQSAINDPSYSVSRLLREVIASTSMLPVSDMIEYFRRERDGDYKVEVPNYRLADGMPVAQNIMGNWVPLGLVGFDEVFFSRVRIVKSIAEIEQMIASANGASLISPYSGEMIAQFRRLDPGLLNAGVRCGVYVFQNVLDQVRNRLLDFTLSIEKAEPPITDLPKEVPGPKDARLAADDIKGTTTIINIENFHGIAGAVHSSHIQIGDYTSVHNMLKSSGVSQKERNNFENIIDEAKKLPECDRQTLASRANKWRKENKQFLLNAGTEVAKVF
jgi:hypothetical protein